MHAFETILLMLAAAVALLALARRVGVPYPALLALAGAALALAPLDIPLHVEPDLILALFVAPVLLDAAYDTPVRDLKRDWLPVGGLVLVAVALTTAAVAVVARAMVPALPWSAAVALGAIVAPPDAAAATAVLRQLRLPHRIRVILEGESLLNDASALLIYRLAVGATLAGGSFSLSTVAPAFLLSVAGSLAAGLALAFVWVRVVRMITEAPSSIILQFVGTFGIWLLAERLGLSPILTVVTYAMAIAQSPAVDMPARLRIPSYAVWETAVVVLNVMAFMLIGLELGPVIAAAAQGELADWALVGAAVLATVIATRLAWVMLHNAWMRRHPPTDAGMARSTWQGGLVVGWCGMRGIVTVAAALALPENFPERELLLFVAFAVTLGTLLIQGMALKPLVRLLDIRDDGPVEREIRHARAALAEAGLRTLDSAADAEPLRLDLEAERRAALEAQSGDGRPRLAGKVIRAKALAAQRDRLFALRAEGTIGDDAFHRLEEELDFAELAVGTRL